MKCDLCKKKCDTLTCIKSELGNKWEVELCLLCRGDLFLGLQHQITLEYFVDDMIKDGKVEE